MGDVSKEYLDDVRLRVRNTLTHFDGEITGLINAARADLILGGILPAKAEDETDALIKQAIVTYCKAVFGLDNPEAEKYRASYQLQRSALKLSSGYIGAEV